MIDRPGRTVGLSPDEKRRLLAELLRQEIDTAVVPHPLSYGQQAMWFLYQLAPDSSAYNVAFTARVRSQLDHPALSRALQGLIDRHEPLRTTFSAHDGKPVQLIHHRCEPTLIEIDAVGWDDATLYRRVVDAYREPFDLEQGPVLRVVLFKRGVDDHVMLIAAHHITIDGWGVWVLLDELRTLYAAELGIGGGALPPLRAQFRDFVRWQLETVAGPAGERQWSYWHAQLRPEIQVLELPTDRPRPAAQTFNGATFTFTLGEGLSEAVKELAKNERTTVYTALLAAFHVLLHRYSGLEDIVVGSPVAGRSRSEFAALIGDFINMVALRADLAGAPSFRDFLGQMRETVLAALDHQDFPFPLLVNRLAPILDPSRSPIFQAAFDLQRIQRVGELTELFIPGKNDVRVEVGGLTLVPYPMPQQEGQLDVILQMVEAGGALYGAFKYNTDLFDAATIERMAGHYRILLEGMVADPGCPIDALPMLSAAERRQVLIEWNAEPASVAANRCAHQLIEAQVERAPDAIAIEFASQQLTYRELNNRANQLAHHLARLGVGPEVLVGVYLDRSLDMLIALLAVHKAGGAYVPLDPSYPAERLHFILKDAHASVLITEGAMRPDDLLTHGRAQDACGPVRVVNLDAERHIIAELPSTNLDPTASVENLAYVIHTSGSTGQPKGVQIEHRSLVSFLGAFQRMPGMTAGDVVLARTTLSFDPSIVELFLPLTTGARIVLLGSQAASSGELLTQALETSGANVLQVTPTHCRLLLAAGWQGTPGLKLLVGGEPLNRDLADELLSRVDELWNIYGPTETTVWATAARVTSGGPITVGRPIGNVQALILGNRKQPAPIGVIGDLYIGGSNLMRGYRNRLELNEQSFIALEPGGWTSAEQELDISPADVTPLRLYRTGDLARRRSDGSIELLGRADTQVKVRGFRIELGEIEVALTNLHGVRAAVVVAREDTPGDQRLVAYIQVDEHAAPSPATLRRELKQRLPSYMIPAVFVPVEQFPLTPTGKLDRRALPVPERRRASVDERYVAPQTQTEQAVAKIWSEALSIDRVGAYDNFFDLGGHSLRLVEVLAAIEQQLGVRVNPALAQTQSLGQLAAVCDEMVARGEIRQPKPSPSSNGRALSAVRRMLGAGSRQEAR